MIQKVDGNVMIRGLGGQYLYRFVKPTALARQSLLPQVDGRPVVAKVSAKITILVRMDTLKKSRQCVTCYVSYQGRPPAA